MEKGKFARPSIFFILTFFLSFLIWIPLDLSHFEIGSFRISESLSQVVRLLGVLMPAVSAIMISRIKEGKAGLKLLFSGFKKWDVGWRWWAAALILQPGLLVIAGLVNNLLPGGERISAAPVESLVMVIINAFFLLLATLGEEIGWRGFALPRLQLRFSPIIANLILAFFWMIWHVPFWLLLDTFTQFGWGYLGMNLLMGIPMNFILSWFFNHSRQSLLLPLGFHLVFNLINVLWLPVTLSLRAFWIFIILEWVVCFATIRHLAPKGFKPYIEQV